MRKKIVALVGHETSFVRGKEWKVNKKFEKFKQGLIIKEPTYSV